MGAAQGLIAKLVDQVMASLITPNMFSPSYPLDAVRLAANNITYVPTKGDPGPNVLVHASVWALVTHARAVLATGDTSIEALLDLKGHPALRLRHDCQVLTNWVPWLCACGSGKHGNDQSCSAEARPW